MRIGNNGTEQGYNTSSRPTQFDELQAGNFTRSYQLDAVARVAVNGTPYYKFLLDINQGNSAAAQLLSLDQLRLYVSPTNIDTASNNFANGYNSATGTLGGLSPSYDMNPDLSSTNFVGMNGDLEAGSGSPDMTLLVPVSALGTKPNSFIYLYSQFGGHTFTSDQGNTGGASNAGFEEWVTTTPAINIVKLVNGQDADTPTGPHVAAGSTVNFTYEVTNTGTVPLANVVVTDDKLGTIAGPASGDTNGNGLLDLTETWTYTTTATALAGQQTNVGTVNARDPVDPPGITVTDDNPANYFGDAPAIQVVKFVNSQDADTPTGPHVAVGSTVNFTYVVTNTGNVPLANVAVTDDKLGPITSFTGDANNNGLLDLTETWIYTRTATAVAGQQTNVGTATARDVNDPPGTPVSDDNPANYFGDAPAIQVVKFVNSQDADTPTGPHVAVGSTVTFTYVVTNTGNVPLANVAVTDDKLGPITSFTGDANNNGLLDLTETWTYTTTATAVAGQQANVGTVTARDPNIRHDGQRRQPGQLLRRRPGHPGRQARQRPGRRHRRPGRTWPPATP